MLRKQVVVGVFLLCFELVTAVQPSDSIVSRSSFFLIPYASYQQETSVAPGLAFGCYFKSKDMGRISSISGSAVYTFRKQFQLNVSPRIYFDKGRWFVYSNVSIRNYPDIFYGVGSRSTTLKQAYTSQSASILVQPQSILSKHFFLGTSFSLRFGRALAESSLVLPMSTNPTNFGIVGWDSYSLLSLGLVAAYDTRDNQFYPQQGVFVKSSMMVSRAGWGSSYSVREYSADIRFYQPLFVSHSLAFQAYCAGVSGSTLLPFQILPTIGGSDLLRGFRQGMYRDRLLMVLQTEYRMPVYKRLKAALFCSVGDVMANVDSHIDKLKLSYGAGLRYGMNDAKVHLRFDLAKNNVDDKIQFYITATEAF